MTESTGLEMPDLSGSISISTRPLATILIVGEDVAVRNACAAALGEDGYAVFSAGHVDTLEQLRQRPFDLLICDIAVAESAAAALIGAAREIDATLAVILVGSEQDQNLLRGVAKHGVTSTLTRSQVADELRLEAARVLHQRAVLKENIRRDSLKHLLELSAAFNGLVTVDSLCQELVRIAGREVGSCCGYVLLTPVAEELRLLHIGDHEGWLSDEGWQVLRGAVDEGAPVIFNGVCCGSRMPSQNLALPLTAQGEVIGALLLSGIPAEQLSQVAVQTASLLATHASAALRNAYLYEEHHAALQRLQEIDRLKSEFISIASHELRTPLAIVLGYTTMLLRETLPDRHRDYLQRVIESALRINDIVDDMINLRHLESGQAQLVRTQTTLHELLHESVAAVETLARAKDHALVTEFVSRQDCAVFVDREKFGLIMVNLLTNAVKFTPRGGTITVRGWCGAISASKASEIPLDVPLAPGRWIYVSVTDTGIGIPADQQRRIFERFYQIADSLTREQGGTGLGLAIVRGLVELHGGRVWVRSREGEGSTFAFVLPLFDEDSRSS